jgi:hypothetical protein
MTDRGVVEHTDTQTPEPQAIGYGQTSTEPSFTRVQRPGAANSEATMSSEQANPPQATRWMSSMSNDTVLPTLIGSASLCVCAGVGVWLWVRWQRERNRPINRIRRRAYALRDRMPDEFPEDATRPAIGLGTVLLGIAALAWQQSQARSRSQTRTHTAADTIKELDWQQRLMELKERWTPARIDLERISIPRRWPSP